MKLWTAISILLVCTTSGSPANSQKKECAGIIVKTIKDPPYDFVLTSRIEDDGKEKKVITCVQNNVKGYVRWRWYVPGHTAYFDGPDANDNPRFVAYNVGLNFAEACFVYGNLNTVGKAYFHADGAQLIAISREKDGCEVRLGSEK